MVRTSSREATRRAAAFSRLARGDTAGGLSRSQCSGSRPARRRRLAVRMSPPPRAKRRRHKRRFRPASSKARSGYASSIDARSRSRNSSMRKSNRSNEGHRSRRAPDLASQRNQAASQSSRRPRSLTRHGWRYQRHLLHNPFLPDPREDRERSPMQRSSSANLRTARQTLAGSGAAAAIARASSAGPRVQAGSVSASSTTSTPPAPGSRIAWLTNFSS